MPRAFPGDNCRGPGQTSRIEPLQGPKASVQLIEKVAEAANNETEHLDGPGWLDCFLAYSAYSSLFQFRAGLLVLIFNFNYWQLCEKYPDTKLIAVFWIRSAWIESNVVCCMLYCMFLCLFAFICLLVVVCLTACCFMFVCLPGCLLVCFLVSLFVCCFICFLFVCFCFFLCLFDLFLFVWMSGFVLCLFHCFLGSCFFV